jgi:hypothetical protein
MIICQFECIKKCWNATNLKWGVLPNVLKEKPVLISLEQKTRKYIVSTLKMNIKCTLDVANNCKRKKLLITSHQVLVTCYVWNPYENFVLECFIQNLKAQSKQTNNILTTEKLFARKKKYLVILHLQ